MSLDNRGLAVGLINPGKTVQKDMLLLYFYHFIIFNLFYTQTISLIFIACGTYVLQTTQCLSSNCDRRIWQPEVLQTLLNAQNDESSQHANIFTYNSFTSGGAWLLRGVCLIPFFGFKDVTFPPPRLTYKNRGTQLMQNIARLPQWLLFWCS